MFDKYKEVTYKIVDYDDLEIFINQHYKSHYNIIAANEWNNDSSYPVEAEKGELTDYELGELEDFNYCRVSIILHDLCNRDLIKEGVYLIQVSW